MREYTITKTELKKLLNLSQTTIQNWSIPSKLGKCLNEDGTIDVHKLIVWLYELKKEAEAKQNQPSNESKKYWDGKRSEAEYKQMIEELIPKTEYLQQEKERFIHLKFGVMNLPETFAAKFALSQDQKKEMVNDCKSILMSTQDTFKGRRSDWIAVMNSDFEKKDAE